MSASELDRLRQRISEEDGLVVAFSGGVDSALLAAVAHEVLGSRMLAVTAVSPSLASAERRQAKEFARDRGFAHVEVCTDEAERPEYAANDGNRCFHCKSALFDAVEPLAAAMGAHVTMITTTASKGQDARELGAQDVILSTDKAQMKAARTRFDFILNTIPVSHEIDGYLQLLGRSGRMVIVGALTPMPGFLGFNIIWWNRAVGGSAIGGIPETQEMLDFCAEPHLGAEVEVIPAGKINEAYERVLASDVRYRFVIDTATLS